MNAGCSKSDFRSQFAVTDIIAERIQRTLTPPGSPPIAPRILRSREIRTSRCSKRERRVSRFDPATLVRPVSRQHSAGD